MALDVVRMELGPIGTNCYIVRTVGSEEAVVVDPSGDPAEIRLSLARLGARCVAVLVTHGHWDHIGALAELAEGTGSPVYAPAGDRDLIVRVNERTPPGVHIRPHEPEHELAGGETVELAGVSFEVLFVPGHSPGHLAFAADGSLFSGDVLFAGSVGRTDMPGQDWDTLMASIRRLVDRFPPETIVHSGHGPETTIGRELQTNPFLGELRAAARHAD
jgi:hydroxyacylglutathione hydrolase